MIQIIDLQDPGRDFAALPPCAAALGNFDGVHTAHARLIREAGKLAENLGVSAAVFTFFTGKGELITDFEHKAVQLEKLGVEFLFACRFEDIRNMSPEDFFDRILRDKMKCAGVVCGYNFRFGKMASGDADLLGTLCQGADIAFEKVPAVECGGAPVSSSRIRAAIKAGNVEEAGALLGRPFAYYGKVSHGRSVGNTHNVPTLNIPIPEHSVMPAFGVYFTTCLIGGKAFPSVSNVGIRPTFDESMGKSAPGCEVHLLAFDGDLYDSDVIVQFDAFRRPEMRFPDADSLYRQIFSDVEAAKVYYHLI